MWWGLIFDSLYAVSYECLPSDGQYTHTLLCASDHHSSSWYPFVPLTPGGPSLPQRHWHELVLQVGTYMLRSNEGLAGKDGAQLKIVLKGLLVE